MTGDAGNYRLFFSHGTEDTFIVQEFLKKNVEKSGAKVFVDAGRIEYGDDFRAIILKELVDSHELLVLFTRSSIRRPWVLAEIGAALIRGIRIVAVLYGTTQAELQELGIMSLLGPSRILMLDDFNEYLTQLKKRVEGFAHA
jgi:hypothetical protein